jgi:hypothetical protein
MGERLYDTDAGHDDADHKGWHLIVRHRKDNLGRCANPDEHNSYPWIQ